MIDTEHFMAWKIAPRDSWRWPIKVGWTPNPQTRRLVLCFPGSGWGLTIWLHRHGRGGEPTVTERTD